MSFMILKSTNEKLSNVLIKGQSGKVARKVRGGRAIGWFHEGAYCLLGKYNDGISSESFSKVDRRHNSATQYSCGFGFSACIRALLNSTIKGDTAEYDIPTASNKVCMLNVAVYSESMKRNVERILKASGASITFVRLKGTIYHTIEIERTDSTVASVLKDASCVGLLLSNAEELALSGLDEGFVNRYLGYFNDNGYGYLAYYLFKRNFVQGNNVLDKLSHLFNVVGADGPMLHQFGDTSIQRMDFIAEHVHKYLPVLDMGCGEGRLMRVLEKRLNFVESYTGIDIDERALDRAGKSAERVSFPAEVKSSTDENDVAGAKTIVCTEVLEHMPQDQARIFLNRLLGMSARRIVLTVPNRDFNPLLGMEEGTMRHDDHDWEPSKAEFIAFVEEVIQTRKDFVGDSFGYTVHHVGDIVGDCSHATGIVLEPLVKRPLCIFTVGISGSGKTTYFNENFTTEDEFVHLNRDDIRFGGKTPNWHTHVYNRGKEDRIANQIKRQAENAVKEGKDIICTDTNLGEHWRKYWFNLVDQGYEVICKIMDVKFNEIISRNAQREGGLPYEVLVSQWKQMQRFLEPTLLTYSLDGAGIPVYVCDLDGTLVNCDHRNGDDAGDISADTPRNHVAAMVAGLICSGQKVVFASGRQEKYREASEKQVRAVLGLSDEFELILFMRKEEDYRADYLVKREIAYEIIDGGHTIVAAIDDRKQVIENTWMPLNVPVVNVGCASKRF